MDRRLEEEGMLVNTTPVYQATPGDARRQGEGVVNRTTGRKGNACKYYHRLSGDAQRRPLAGGGCRGSYGWKERKCL